MRLCTFVRPKRGRGRLGSRAHRQSRRALQTLCVVACVTPPGAIAAGQTAVWDGSAGIWEDPAHWSTNPNYPDYRGGTTYDAVINGGSVTQSSYGLTVDRLTLSDASLAAYVLAANLGWTVNGNSAWAAGSVFVGGTGTTNNGTLDLQADVTLGSVDNSLPAFSNVGTLIKSVGQGGSTNFNAAFTNAGTVDVRAGWLSVNGGYTQTAGETKLSGGGLISNTALDLRAGKLSGAGDLNAAVNVAGAVSIEPAAAGILNPWENLTVDGAGAAATLADGTLQVGRRVYYTYYTRDLAVGVGGPGSFTQSGGTNDITRALILGELAAGDGHYALTAGTLKVATDENVGEAGTGVFDQTGGEQTVSGNLTVAGQQGAVGTYSLKNSNLTVGTAGQAGTGVLTVGRSGTGAFTQAGGDVELEGDLVVGKEADGTGEYTLKGGTLNGTGDAVVGAAGHGTFNHNDGTHGANRVVVGRDAGGHGTYTQAAGTTNGPAGIDVGSHGYGDFYHFGGTVATYLGALRVGAESDGRGTYTLADGAELQAKSEVVGDAGHGDLVQIGGTNHVGLSQEGVISGTLYVGGQAGGRGTYTLSGGEVKALNITVGHHGGGLFAQSGGTVTLPLNGSPTDPQGDLLVVGDSPDVTARYQMTGGTLDVQEEHVGENPLGGGSEQATGVFHQEGGVHTVGAKGLYVGMNAGSFGVYELQSDHPDFDAHKLSALGVTVGYQGHGRFVHSAGLHEVGTANSHADLVIADKAGSFGEYRLSDQSTVGGASSQLLVSGNETVGRLGLGAFTQTGGLHQVAGTLTVAAGGAATYHMSGGNLQVRDETLGTNADALETSGGFDQTGGTHTVSAALTLGATNNSAGLYTLAGGTLNAGSVAVRRGAFLQSGGEANVTNDLQISAGATATLSGGTLSAANVRNAGTFEFSGGTLTGNLVNDGTANFSGGGARVIDGNFTNNPGATYKTTNTTVMATGQFTDNGQHVSDPSDEYYNDLTIGRTGVIAGWGRNRYFIGGDFMIESTRGAEWDTRANELHFDGATSHAFTIAGDDRGADPRGYDRNFAWSELALGRGAGLALLDGNATAGGALYVDTVVLADGVAQVGSIEGNGLSIYYDPALPDNAYLAGRTYALGGGGSLAPVPEPAAGGMVGLLSAAGLLRRRRRRPVGGRSMGAVRDLT